MLTWHALFENPAMWASADGERIHLSLNGKEPEWSMTLSVDEPKIRGKSLATVFDMTWHHSKQLPTRSEVILAWQRLQREGVLVGSVMDDLLNGFVPDSFRPENGHNVFYNSEWFRFGGRLWALGIPKNAPTGTIVAMYSIAHHDSDHPVGQRFDRIVMGPRIETATGLTTVDDWIAQLEGIGLFFHQNRRQFWACVDVDVIEKYEPEIGAGLKLWKHQVMTIPDPQLREVPRHFFGKLEDIPDTCYFHAWRFLSLGHEDWKSVLQGIMETYSADSAAIFSDAPGIRVPKNRLTARWALLDLARHSPYFCIPMSKMDGAWKSGDALLVLGIGEEEAREWADRFYGSPDAAWVIRRPEGVGN